MQRIDICSTMTEQDELGAQHAMQTAVPSVDASITIRRICAIRVPTEYCDRISDANWSLERKGMAKHKSKAGAAKNAANPVEETAEVGDQADRVEAEGDADLTGGSVTLRWGREQIAVVKRAATLVGVPYQTYLKQVVFKQALVDIERAEAVLPKRRSG
jgi:hypothetical protein